MGQEDALAALGLRSSSAKSLGAAVTKAIADLGIAQDVGAGGAGGAGASVMQLPSGITKPKPWENAVYKQGKTLKPWEISYERFSQGQSVEAIALNQLDAKGNPKRAVLPSTVSSHLLTAMQHGRALDLARLASEIKSSSPAPTEREWEQLDEAAAVSGVDVLQPDAYKKQLLAAIVGDELADSKERTEAEQLLCQRW